MQFENILNPQAENYNWQASTAFGGALWILPIALRVFESQLALPSLLLPIGFTAYVIHTGVSAATSEQPELPLQHNPAPQQRPNPDLVTRDPVPPAPTPPAPPQPTPPPHPEPEKAPFHRAYSSQDPLTQAPTRRWLDDRWQWRSQTMARAGTLDRLIRERGSNARSLLEITPRPHPRYSHRTAGDKDSFLQMAKRKKAEVAEDPSKHDHLRFLTSIDLEDSSWWKGYDAASMTTFLNDTARSDSAGVHDYLRCVVQDSKDHFQHKFNLTDWPLLRILPTLLDAEIDIQAKDRRGLTFLHLFADNQHWGHRKPIEIRTLVDLFVFHGADFGAQVAEDCEGSGFRAGETPLHVACRKRHLSTATALYHRMDGAALDLKDNEGKTPRSYLKAEEIETIRSGLPKLDEFDTQDEQKLRELLSHE